MGRLAAVVAVVGVLAGAPGARAAGPTVLPVTVFPVPTPGGGGFGITVGPDGNLWFADPGSNAIGRITPAGVVTEFPVPTPAGQPNLIAAGPDGNLWFTEFNGNKIGRITPAGVVTEFPLPTATAKPSGITAGPDGNLWYTKVFGPGVIGKITPTGVITEYPYLGTVFRIGAGPDGNVWFGSSNKVAKITPTGVITEFPLPPGGPSAGTGDVLGVTTGLDRNLWFVRADPNRIARVTPAGVVTEFALPTAGAKPSGIAAGLDGSLWFTEIGASKIGRITAAGVITEFPLPPAAPFASLLTLGPDGNVWFTGGAKIGRLGLAPVPGDFDADGKADIVTGTGQGGGPHVRVLSGVDGHEILSLFAYDPGFTGGVRVAACDVTGDGVPDVVTGAGFGGGPHIRTFDGATGLPLPGAIGSFFAYDPGVFNGAFVACGDVNGDGVPDVITGAGPGGASHVRAWSGVDATELLGFFAYGTAFVGGVYVGP